MRETLLAVMPVPSVLSGTDRPSPGRDAGGQRYSPIDQITAASVAKLEAGAHATPITCLGKDGRQYAVAAAGEGSCQGPQSETKLVAFALAEGRQGAGSAVTRVGGDT